MISLHNKVIEPTSQCKSRPSGDPFSEKNMDMDLYVTRIAPDHTLVLNKFNTIPNHVIISVIFI